VSALSVRDAFRIYGQGPRAVVALQGLTLDVDPGEIVVVLGPSGSGKTTLLRVVAGLERLSAGVVVSHGLDIGRLDRRQLAAYNARELGFLDQHYARALSPELPIRDAIGLQLTLRGTPVRDARRAADDLLARVGLADRSRHLPGTLSGGEQQRVALCASLAHRPRLLLVDEPAGELDAESAATVYALIAELARGAGATTLVVSHDQDAARIADRIVHVRDGRVVEEREPTGEPDLVVSPSGWVRLPGGGGPGLLTVEREGTIERRHLRGGARSAGQGAPPPPAVAGEPIAELRGVDKAYDGRAVLTGFDLTARRGTLTALVGRSGTGKTTALHVLAGLERPTAGEVLVEGVSLAEKSRAALAEVRRETFAIVTQEPGLVPHLNARENILLGLGLRGISNGAERTDTALADVGLAELRLRRAVTLSAGERQRVAVARALASRAPLLLADEPTARLDEENARAIGVLLARAARLHGVAVVCATHDETLIGLADNVVQLDFGSSNSKWSCQQSAER
jgi:ABC-type lipoprotein export system ATPase subunit